MLEEDSCCRGRVATGPGRGWRVFGRWRRRRAVAKVKPGDGRPLRPYHPVHMLWRSLFTLELAGPGVNPVEYAVDVNFFDLSEKAELYRDGSQHAVASLPAAFPVPGGVIEVAASTYGMKRVHLALDSGEERQLHPAPRTAEFWRARLAHRHPRLSRWIGWAAVAVLLNGLVLIVPQALEQLTRIPEAANLVGTFTSPFSPPPWLNTTLLVAGILAAMERALTLRNHWLIDADTWWLD